MLSNRTTLVGAGLLFAGVLVATSTPGLAQRHKKTVPKKLIVVTPVAPLTLAVKTDQPTYPADSAIRFTLTAKNTTQQDIPLRFTSGQHYDFELFRGKDAKGEKIWQWARGKMFTMMLSSTTLKPGKSLAFLETYHPGSDGMPSLTPGTYIVVATLKSASKSSPLASVLSASTAFKVN